MKTTQLAAQLYTFRESCENPRQLAKTLRAISDVGLQAVEVAGICPMDPAELRHMAEDCGLTICSFHGTGGDTLGNPAKVAAEADVLGCDIVVYSYPEGFDLTNTKDVCRLVDLLRLAASEYRSRNKTFCYHHHSLEFFRHDGKTVLGQILDEVNQVSLELDTYWIQHGGGSPVDWCRKLSGRLPIIHLKDFGSIQGVPTMMEVGNGNLDWPAILESAEIAGCKWFVIEQDTCPGDPLDSLRASYAYLLSQSQN
jgi:sugar phosphate isomerase/epimerase